MEQLMGALEELAGNTLISDPSRARRIASSITEVANTTRIPAETVANLAAMGAQHSEMLGLTRDVGASATLNALVATSELYRQSGLNGSLIPESMGRVQAEVMNRFQGEQSSVTAERARNLLAITQGADSKTFSPQLRQLLGDIQNSGTDREAATRALQALRSPYEIGEMLAKSGLASNSGNGSQLLESKYLGRNLTDEQQQTIGVAVGGLNRANEAELLRYQLTSGVQSTLGLLGTDLNLDEAVIASQQAIQTIQDSPGDEHKRLREVILKRAGGEAAIRRNLSKQGLSRREINSRLSNIDSQINEIVAEAQTAAGSPEKLRAMQASRLQSETQEQLQRNVAVRHVFSDAGIGNESLMQRLFEFVRTASPGTDIGDFINYSAGIPAITSGTKEENADTLRGIVTDALGGSDAIRRYQGKDFEHELADTKDPGAILHKYLPVVINQALKSGKAGEAARDSISKLMRQGPGAVPMVLAEAYQQMMRRHEGGESLDKLKKEFAPLFKIMKDQGYDERTLQEAAGKVFKPQPQSDFVGPPAPSAEDRAAYPAEHPPFISPLSQPQTGSAEVGPPAPDTGVTSTGQSRMTGKSDQPKPSDPVKVIIVGVNSDVSMPVSTGPREAD
jgi:hypothetical protein